MNLSIPTVLADAAASGEDQPLDLGSHAANAHASSGGSLVRTIVGLAVVLAVILGLRWVLKQVKASREEKASGRGLSSMATLPLGSNRSLHVVRAGREVLVVGSGEHGVTPVRSYDEAQARALGVIDDDPHAEPEPPRRPPGRFRAYTARNRPVGTLKPLPDGDGGVLETLRAWTVRR